jgi:hypothetical protein
MNIITAQKPSGKFVYSKQSRQKQTRQKQSEIFNISLKLF